MVFLLIYDFELPIDDIWTLSRADNGAATTKILPYGL
jgi:hypothetical protein